MNGLLECRAAVAVLKAAAEPTRLRILVQLAAGELNVTDLTHILGQSQPRISRHLKLLTEAGLIDRFREGSWVYFRLAAGSGGAQIRHVLAAIDPADGVLARDRARAEQIKRQREAAAQTYFREHAAEWDKIRALHVSAADVEAAMRAMLGPRHVELLVDLGTGTGRILEVLADRYEQGLGIDLNQAMLAYARSKIGAAGLSRVQVRHGDIYNLALGEASAGAVIMHQVLHFLREPARAIAEAARVLKPGGHLLIVDFAPHDLEILRDRFAHERLGFERRQIEAWLTEAGLSAVSYRELTPSHPSGGDPKLAVSLWLGRRSEAKAPARGESRARAQRERVA